MQKAGFLTYQTTVNQPFFAAIHFCDFVFIKFFAAIYFHGLPDRIMQG